MSASLCWKNRTMVFALRTLIIFLSVNSVLFAFAKKESTSTSSKSADSVKAVNNPSTKHSEPIIEDVTAKQLEKILNEKDYVAVFWCKYKFKIFNKTFTF